VVTGRVADTRPYLAHAAAVVAPLRVARGIQNKVLEGMAMGRPVIASPQAFEGIRAEPGRDLLLARDADGFVAALDRVSDAAAAAELGRNARRAIEANYDWSVQLAALDAVLARIGDGTNAARERLTA
jgi:glycosyltransferase involved in cell wall biosynthesis